MVRITFLACWILARCSRRPQIMARTRDIHMEQDNPELASPRPKLPPRIAPSTKATIDPARDRCGRLGWLIPSQEVDRPPCNLQWGLLFTGGGADSVMWRKCKTLPPSTEARARHRLCIPRIQAWASTPYFMAVGTSQCMVVCATMINACITIQVTHRRSRQVPQVTWAPVKINFLATERLRRHFRSRAAGNTAEWSRSRCHLPCKGA